MAPEEEELRWHQVASWPQPGFSTSSQIETFCLPSRRGLRDDTVTYEPPGGIRVAGD